ncbi:MAG TPA: hypothetical protein VL688_05270 [Verrucomicrobiae bacterium]|jgi:hypothetical protein|nr:hypothetical protein [Verrucomicrobiae bacterium]
MIKYPNIAVAAASVISGLLFLLCSSLTWAGVYAYQGSLAFKAGDYETAETLFDRASALGWSDPTSLYEEAQSFWKKGLAKKDVQSIGRARDKFRETVRWVPVFSKARLLRLQAEAKMAALEKRPIDAAAWASWEKEIESIVDEQPNNAWINYMAGTFLLSRGGALDPEEQLRGAALLKRAVDIYPEHYTKPALSFLWPQLHDDALLRSVAGDGFAALARLVSFYEQRHLWKQWHYAYSDYLEKRRGEYKRLTGEALALMKTGAFAAAAIKFRQAAWVDPAPAMAKAGEAVAIFHEDEVLTQHAREWIREGLEEESLDGLEEFLEPLVPRFKDPYLKGLYFSRQGNHEKALESFDQAGEGGKYRFWYKAKSLAALDRREEAVKLLAGRMAEKKAGLRELLLLEAWAPDPEMKALASAAVQAGETRSLGPQAWQSKAFRQGILNGPGEAGAVVALEPGQASICVAARQPEAAGAPGALLFRLGAEIVGTGYVQGTRWQPVCFEVQTAGGKYWLSVSLAGAAEKTGSSVQLGALRVKSGQEVTT